MAGWYAAQGYVDNTGTPIEQVAQTYLEEGAAEGVRGDVAFAQAIHESAGFYVSDGENNYAGIGACTACAQGYDLSSLRMFVRAQIELLEAYDDAHYTEATTARPAAYPYIDTLAVRGEVQTWAGLSGVWAPGLTYGQSVLILYQSMLEWAEVHPTS